MKKEVQKIIYAHGPILTLSDTVYPPSLKKNLVMVYFLFQISFQLGNHKNKVKVPLILIRKQYF